MLFERPEAGHRAVVLQVELKRQANPGRGELVELAKSAEIDVVDVVVARRDVPQPRTYIGSGKVDETRQALAA
ncbi:MAG: GTPase HflX, partial [Gammaproteobacteria bacterium]|nr:GTPase HflX [Gammaproteobacteria bacterium]